MPISAIIFGGRRESLVPLVFEAKDWEHGVLVGASMASETTAAATGKVGVVRRDSMAMKPFCGYKYADYFAHWLSFGEQSEGLPKIFHVNWFRKDENGKFMWPGFGDNLRVLEWIIDRCKGSVDATETAIGYLPTDNGINRDGLEIDQAEMEALLKVDEKGYAAEMDSIGDYLEGFGDRMPVAMHEQLEKVRSQL